MSHPLCLLFESAGLPRPGAERTSAAPSKGGSVPRVLALQPGVAFCVGGDGREEGRPVAEVSWRDGRPILRDLTGRGVSSRGQRHRELPLSAGDLLAIDRFGEGAGPAGGRTRILVAQRLPDEAMRPPEVPTIAWQGLITASARGLAQLFDLATAAGVQAPVWIHGESGTGKELAAHAIHAAGARARAPLEAINCAALPENLIESELFGVERGAYTGAMRSRAGAFMRANGGTLFLDEVGELPLAAQAKLLRVLETQEVRPVGGDRAVKVDVRVLAASWRDLEDEVARGRFRHDLLHRLWVLRVQLAPLRERPGDVAPILRALLAPSRAERVGVVGGGEAGSSGPDPLMPDPWLLARMEAQLWPGNVRELKNCVARAVATGRSIDLLPLSGAMSPVGTTRRQVGRRDEALTKALELNRGNRARSARALGISRSTLYRWMAACVTHPRAPDLAGGGLRAGLG